MIHHSISNWDDAYANSTNIPGGDRWADRWIEAARLFRDKLAADGRARLDIPYGDGPRNRVDLFFPKGQPKGLVVFVHGGYWMAFDKSCWSHLAEGCVRSDYMVAMPSYT